MPVHAPLALALLSVFLVAVGPPTDRGRWSSPQVVQEVVTRPGFVEPHTPGSGAPEAFLAAPVIETLLGPAPDLNRITYLRTALDAPPGPPPRVILILIPGFLGGATTFDPLARDLVERSAGHLEVWAVDRRPNQLEDRLGSLHAAAGAEHPSCLSSPPAPDCSIFEGARFYFGDADITGDGVSDPPLLLEDAFGVLRGPALMTQDDVRFMAHWGLDTYFRDWKILVGQARRRVGPKGLVLLGGHSQGTAWASLFAAYDFDPDPAVTVPGYTLIDALVLLEGGGAGLGSAPPPTLAEYLATVASLALPGGPEVFLESFSGIPLQALATSGEVAALAAFYQPFESALIQRTPVFGGFPLSIFLSAPATNRAIAGMFLDDDFSPNTAFRVSVGFTDDGPNQFVAAVPGFIGDDIYVAQPAPEGGLRTWKDFDDPTLPTCPPNRPRVSPGCAILDNGPPSDPDDPTEPPRKNGVEREVTPIDAFLQTQFGKANGFEWYFASGRPFLDFSYGRDASTLVAEHLATVDPSHEGPLVITQNAQVDVPVIAIGGSNGLTPEPKAFASYLGSIATPEAWKEVHILEGYAHLDLLTAADNEALALIEAFIDRMQVRRHPRRH
jgi:pimeloyl-ACP methyl ester carboxylesterase